MKNIQLLTAAVIIVVIASAYGIYPGKILPQFFDFKVDTTDLKEVFRATMGLYAGMAFLWSLGIFRSRYWKTATISSIVFMGGLAAGRLISFILDGMPSVLFLIGFVIEMALALWGYVNLKKYGEDN